MLFGHSGYLIPIPTVEVEEPGLGDDFAGLGLHGFDIAEGNPAVDGGIGIADDVDNIGDRQCIGDGGELIFEPVNETVGK